MPQEREPAAKRAAPGGGCGVGLLVGGQAASTIGDACHAVALPWYVLTGHGGAAAPGTTLAAYGVARAAAMPDGGLLCDRLGARRVLLLVDVLRAVLIGGLAVQVTLRPPSLVTLFSAWQAPARVRSCPARARYARHRARTPPPASQRRTHRRPPGQAAAFALDAATFAISALTLASLRPVAVPPQEQHTAPKLRAVLAATPALPVMLVVVLAGNVATGNDREPPFGASKGVLLWRLTHAP